jgi:putative acetyltransferase
MESPPWLRPHTKNYGIPQRLPAGDRNSAEISVSYIAPVIADGQIAQDDPRKPDVQALLGRHLRFALGQTPPEHSFALDTAGLLDPAVTLFSFRADGGLLGIGAIRRLDAHHAEIKSMHIAEAARGRGIGTALLDHLLGVARAEGYGRVSLETGTTAAFAPARALYQRAGFVECGPFAGYQPSEDNLFMTLELRCPSAGELLDGSRGDRGEEVDEVAVGVPDQE